MLTYEEKNELKDQAKAACITAKELQATRIKQGYKTMYKKENNTKVLVSPNNFEKRLKDGFKLS